MKKLNFQPSLSVLSAMMIGMTSLPTLASETLTAEVEQLRQEVRELRALIAQQAQTQQTVQQTQQQLVSQIETAKTAQVNSPALKTVSGSDFKVYGNVRLDASYQVEGGAATIHPYNQINRVALDGVNENSDQFKTTLAATRLGLDFKTPVGEDSISGKVEVDFLGGANLDNLRIRHAYFNYGNWLLGQTWSNFAVPDYMPETIDALAFVGGAVKRTPQARYQFDLQPTTKVFVALEDPKDGSIKQRLPALTARLNHSFADNAGIISVRGMLHEKKITQDDTVAWGTGIGIKYNVMPDTTLKADYYHVKGDSSFVSWTNSGIVEKAGRIASENEFDSITLGVTQQLNPKLRATLGYGYMKADVDQDYKNAVVDLTAVNKELWQAWANVFYSPTKPISLGLEYVYGEREAVGKAANGSQTGEDNRVNAVAIYNF